MLLFSGLLILSVVGWSHGECTYNGVTYPEGQFRPNPCTPCACYNKIVTCANIDCPPPDCVDPASDPDQCCPVCPNGPNCRTPDGTVIPAGHNVEVHPGTFCHCIDAGGFGFFMTQQLTATCAHTVVDIGVKK